MSQYFHVATRKGLFRIDRKGSTWSIGQVSFLGDHVTMVLADTRDETIYAALRHGHFGVKLHRSKDGGSSWEEIASPQYPPQVESEVAIDANRNKPIPWTLDTIWAMEAGHKNEPGVLWVGTLPGGLFRSADRGATWELNRPLWDMPARMKWSGGGADLPGIHSICIDPRDSKKMHIAVSSGGVWYTEDGGASWAPRCTGMWSAYMPPEQKGEPSVQDPHRIVQCPAAPDHLWQQHHNAAFRSTDGGLLWQDLVERPPSVFGFAVAVHPKDPNIAWFVPAHVDEKRIPLEGKVVVTRTRDGAKTYEVLRKGLPQDHAYDLVYRHALDVDDTGNSLAFGSTTGSLWVSDDGGDSFQAVSEHLPPIFCVRFVK